MRERTEVRGPDEFEDLDWSGTSPMYRRVYGRMPTERELKERPFVRDPLQTVRCWCGCPIKDSTGTCHLSHVQRDYSRADQPRT